MKSFITPPDSPVWAFITPPDFLVRAHFDKIEIFLYTQYVLKPIYAIPTTNARTKTMPLRFSASGLKPWGGGGGGEGGAIKVISMLRYFAFSDFPETNGQRNIRSGRLVSGKTHHRPCLAIAFPVHFQSREFINSPAYMETNRGNLINFIVAIFGIHHSADQLEVYLGRRALPTFVRIQDYQIK